MLSPTPHFNLNLSRKAYIPFHPVRIPDLYNGGVVDPIQGAISVFSDCRGSCRADGVSAGGEIGPMMECDDTRLPFLEIPIGEAIPLGIGSEDIQTPFIPEDVAEDELIHVRVK